MTLRSFAVALALLFASVLSAQNTDIDLLRKMHDPLPHKGDRPLRIVSGSVLPMMIAVPIGIGIYNYAGTRSLTQNTEHFTVAGSILVSGTITLGLKYAVDRPRPFVTHSDITQKDQHVGPYSFPSGHTAQAFALATSVSLCYPKWYVIAPSFAWAFTVGYSRMWLGVHYPGDVLTGAIIGTASAFGTYYFMRWITR